MRVSTVRGRSSIAYFTLNGSSLIIAISVAANADFSIASLNTSSLGEVLLSLLSSNLYLLFLASTTQLIGFETVLCLELGAAMFGDVSFSHDAGFRDNSNAIDVKQGVSLWH
jgi:hypothetical protein